MVRPDKVSLIVREVHAEHSSRAEAQNSYSLKVVSSRRRHTRSSFVTGVQTCALPIYIPLSPKHPLITDNIGPSIALIMTVIMISPLTYH